MLLGWFEKRMIYLPLRGGGRDPASHGLPARDLYLEAEDGVRLHAWWVPALEEDPPTLLFFHGNAGNLTHRIELLRLLRQSGPQILALEYRGYGRSQGSPSEEGLYRDARAAYRELERRGVAPERLVIHGRSLGGAVAARLAAEHRCAGLVLESTFTSVPDMAALRFGRPAAWLVRSRFPVEETVRRLDVPVLILHGEEDDTIPVSMSRRLHRAAGGRAELWLVPGAHHNDLDFFAGEDYARRLGGFLRKVTESQKSPRHPP